MTTENTKIVLNCWGEFYMGWKMAIADETDTDTEETFNDESKQALIESDVDYKDETDKNPAEWLVNEIITELINNCRIDDDEKTNAINNLPIWVKNDDEIKEAISNMD